MREILFRGKRIDNGEWAFGSYCLAEKLDRNGNEHCIIEYAANGGSYRVDPSTIGQYTGFTDKNGKKIFEGDIVATRTSGMRIEKLKGYYGYDSDGYPQKIPGYDGISEYRYSCLIDCYAKVEFDPTNGGFYLNGADMFIGAICNEIVGNIHDNPELMK